MKSRSVDGGAPRGRPRDAMGVVASAMAGVAVTLSVVASLSGCVQSEISNLGADAAPRPDSGHPLAAPTRAGFEVLADALQPRCGTLDCHGQIGRNLRLFGGRGLRLRAEDNPSDGKTTADEYDATYWSLIALEPEILTAVVRDRGERAERLSLIRKGRGIDLHKGAALIRSGDTMDLCLLAWLAGAAFEPFCRAAVFTHPAPLAGGS